MYVKKVIVPGACGAFYRSGGVQGTSSAYPYTKLLSDDVWATHPCVSSDPDEALEDMLAEIDFLFILERLGVTSPELLLQGISNKHGEVGKGFITCTGTWSNQPTCVLVERMTRWR